jgi:pyruvate-formate lyase-activating enzyme
LHLAEVLELRAQPAAGILIGLTRRCPLSCEHCSTSSTMSSEEAPAEMFERFVASFRPDDRPELMVVSGGEAFLRPALLQRMADRARIVGCRTMALSGMFWASERRIPPPIRRAIDSLDHFSASLDMFHEREVRREDVYRVFDTLLSEGKDVSFHLVGLGPDDPYLVERTEEIRRTFDDRVPIVVNSVGAAGRAAAWLKLGPAPEAAASPDPCTRAAWPLVAFDGTIVACGNDEIAHSGAPAHLRLGHVGVDGWPEVRARTTESPLLRAIRTFGPRYLADRYGESTPCNGYCSTCARLGGEPALTARVAVAMSGEGARTVEEQVISLTREAGPASFIKRFGMPKYAHLVTLAQER